MPLSIMVRLQNGRYDAGGQRPSESEWPPHPARIFCALAASAVAEPDWVVLRWLEQQEPPQVWAEPINQVQRIQARAYVVQNAVEREGGNLTWPGRTNGLRARASTVPTSESFAIVWPDVDPPADVVNRLNLLAWKVPYVGRSSSLAQVSVVGMLPSELPGAGIHEPADFGSGRALDLRIPYPGYTDALRDAYLDGRRAWEVARTRPYRYVRGTTGRNGQAEMTDAVPGPFTDLMVWGIERPVARIGGDQVAALAGSLRKAVISLVPDPVPGQVSGHTDPGRPHVGFLVLPDVAHRHADGHVLGLALAIPEDLPEDELASLLRALILEPPMDRVPSPSGRPLAIRYGAGRGGLRPSRWTAADRKGEREWVTATPMMVDGHVRRGSDAASQVARSLKIAGYPEPAEVEVSGTPLVAGAVWRPRPGTLPKDRPRRQIVHARVRFQQPVIGPVLAGSLRYLGLGLFLPARPQQCGLEQPGSRQRSDRTVPSQTAVRDRVGVSS